MTSYKDQSLRGAMSDRVGIWSMTRSDAGSEIATPVDELQSTETEQKLEDCASGVAGLSGAGQD